MAGSVVQAGHAWVLHDNPWRLTCAATTGPCIAVPDCSARDTAASEAVRAPSACPVPCRMRACSSSSSCSAPCTAAKWYHLTAHTTLEAGQEIACAECAQRSATTTTESAAMALLQSFDWHRAHSACAGMPVHQVCPAGLRKPCAALDGCNPAHLDVSRLQCTRLKLPASQLLLSLLEDAHRLLQLMLAAQRLCQRHSSRHPAGVCSEGLLVRSCGLLDTSSMCVAPAMACPVKVRADCC